MKKWYESKTIWLGVLAVATAALTAYQSGEQWPAIVLAGFGVLSIFLRKNTTTAIK